MPDEGPLAHVAHLLQPREAGAEGQDENDALLVCHRHGDGLRAVRGPGRRPHAGPRDAGALRPRGRSGDAARGLQDAGGAREVAPRPAERQAHFAARPRPPLPPRDLAAVQHHSQRSAPDFPRRSDTSMGRCSRLRHLRALRRRDHTLRDLHRAQPDVHRGHVRARGEAPAVRARMPGEADRERARPHHHGGEPRRWREVHPCGTDRVVAPPRPAGGRR
mmetsp:Transcript_93147/g.263647  ORF Transcript_93147/g.263647 Transcript_93147/m.263647 type:complete len:219 (-) Transcript_93147:380-1036(-)